MRQDWALVLAHQMMRQGWALVLAQQIQGDEQS
jgi:hypothetical protein